MLDAHTLQRIKGRIDPEFSQRSEQLLPTVEARLRKLIGSRGQGGHLDIDVNSYLKEELCARVQLRAQITIEVANALQLEPTDQLAGDLYKEVATSAQRDIESSMGALKRKYPWIRLDQASIQRAQGNELSKQRGIVAVDVDKAHLGTRKPRPSRPSAPGIDIPKLPDAELEQYMAGLKPDAATYPIADHEMKRRLAKKSTEAEGMRAAKLRVLQAVASSTMPLRFGEYNTEYSFTAARELHEAGMLNGTPYKPWSAEEAALLDVQLTHQGRQYLAELEKQAKPFSVANWLMAFWKREWKWIVTSAVACVGYLLTKI